MDNLDKKLTGFRQIAQEKLQNVFVSISNTKKDIVIDPVLIKPLEHVCGASWLRLKGIDKIYKFDPQNGPIKRAGIPITYFTSSDLRTLKNILDQIREILQKTNDNIQTVIGQSPKPKDFHIIMFPNVLHAFEKLVEEEGLHGLVEMYRYNWDFITVDRDVLSLEIPYMFRNTFMKHDSSLLSSVAHSFRILNLITKRPNIVLTYGTNSGKIIEMCNQYEEAAKQSSDSSTGNNSQSDFSAMLLIDRDKDYPVCLLTPVVYSGLLMEVFECNSGTYDINIENNRIKSEALNIFAKIPNGIKTPDSKLTEIPTPTSLRFYGTNDDIYEENRYKHFSEVVGLISAQTKAIGMERENVQGMQVNEMHEFVSKKLPTIAKKKSNIFKHMSLCETILAELGSKFETLNNLDVSMLYNQNKKQTFSKIMELLTTDPHKYYTLRHICMLYVSCDLTLDEAISFMTNYLNTFGYQYLEVFNNLMKAKLFPNISQMKKTKILSQIQLPKWQHHFQFEANKLKLLPLNRNEKVDVKSISTCPSYVFNGAYIPLIAQLALQLCTAENFDVFTSKLTYLDQQLKVKNYYNKLYDHSLKEIAALIDNGTFTDVFPLKPRSIFIFIVGGVTLAEIAACNCVEKLTGSKIVIGSTHLITGCDLMRDAFS